VAAAKASRHTTEAETSTAIQVQDRRVTPALTATRLRTPQAHPIRQEGPSQAAEVGAALTLVQVVEEAAAVLRPGEAPTSKSGTYGLARRIISSL
jgi:hypothetical protein